MHLKFSYFVNNEEILNILVNLFIEAETAEGVILLKTQHTFCKEYKQGEIIQAIANAFATSNLLSGFYTITFKQNFIPTSNWCLMCKEESA